RAVRPPSRPAPRSNLTDRSSVVRARHDRHVRAAAPARRPVERNGRAVSLSFVPGAGSQVETARDGAIARLVMNRPERRNALSHEMMTEMLAELDRVAADPAAHVLVIEGRGPAFSAGHDLVEMTSNRDAEFYEALFATCVRLMTRLHELPQPVIARVHGVATAAGC